MTTKKELLLLAENHKRESGIISALLTIKYNEPKAAHSLGQVQFNARMLEDSLKQGTMYDHHHFELARQASSALAEFAVLNEAYLTLATLLQGLGETVEYY
jgi:hypothetical protein